MKKEDGSKVFVVIALLIAIISVLILIVVVNKYYLNTESEPTQVEEVPEVTEEPKEEEPDEEETEEQVDAPKYDDETEDKESEEPVEEQPTKVAETPEQEPVEQPVNYTHGRRFNDYVARDGSAEAAGLIEQDQETLNAEFEEAKGFLTDPAYMPLFENELPKEWKLKVMDCLDYTDGRTEYFYEYENTEVILILTRENKESPFVLFGYSVECGSDYPAVYFSNGVPSNSIDIYDKLISTAGFVWGNYSTDYKEGDSTVTLKKWDDPNVVYADLPL